MKTPLTREQRIDLPNTLLLDPATCQAAAYNGIHRLITGSASAALVAYAKAKGYKEVAWYEMPKWASKEVRARSTLIWVRSGTETDEELRSIPRT